MDEELARLQVSAPRRVFGVAVVGALGVLLVWMGVTTHPAAGFRVGLVVVGAAAIGGAVRMWQATALGLVLGRDALRDTEGRLLAEVDDIAAVDRGMFAARPSNGFVLRLSRRGERAWAPGLWWRAGRRVGVGGMTRSAEARTMADIIAALVAEREAPR